MAKKSENNNKKRTYGSGTLYYDDKNKRYVGQIKIPTFDGKIKKRSVSGKTAKETKEKLKKLQEQIIKGDIYAPSNITIPTIAQNINDNKKALNIVGAAAYGRNQYTISIIKESSIGNTPVQQLTEIALTAFFSEITNKSNSVIKKVYAATNAALKKAIKMGIIKYNPLDEIVCPKSKKETRKIRALTIDEQRKLIAALDKDNKEPYRTMLLLSLNTGMRMGEVAALRLSDILLNYSTIRICRTLTRDENYKTVIGERTKTYSGLRNIKLSINTQSLVKSYVNKYFVKNEENLLFITKRKGLISTNQVNLYYRRLIERYGIAPVDECNQHQLRHTYATRCIEAGMPAKVLQHQLGHADVTITLNTYCDVFEGYADTYIDQTNEYLKQHNLIV
ncbi:MAG: site-specific integrase [Clostridiales bacterium]|nr:site-specific integrase [Clostridiales bacterium]